MANREMVGRAAMVAAAMAAVVLIVVVSSTSPAKVVPAFGAVHAWIRQQLARGRAGQG
jgi:hypothetical protein